MFLCNGVELVKRAKQTSSLMADSVTGEYLFDFFQARTSNGIDMPGAGSLLVLCKMPIAPRECGTPRLTRARWWCLMFSWERLSSSTSARVGRIWPYPESWNRTTTWDFSDLATFSSDSSKISFHCPRGWATFLGMKMLYREIYSLDTSLAPYPLSRLRGIDSRDLDNTTYLR